MALIKRTLCIQIPTLMLEFCLTGRWEASIVLLLSAAVVQYHSLFDSVGVLVAAMLTVVMHDSHFFDECCFNIVFIATSRTVD